MANKYKISPKSLYSFINEGIYKLPRFQRKDTWKDNQYFELCLSVFQDYPIGSVIVNNDGKNLWLLDGRQRRTCIKTLFENPTKFYEWARKSCSFKQNDQDDIVYDKYYKKVEDFLGRDLEEQDSYSTNDSDSMDYSPDNSDVDSYDDENPSKSDIAENKIGAPSLRVLYNYILLSHHKLLKAFNFKEFFSEKAMLKAYYYRDEKNELAIDPVRLSQFIREINKDPNRSKIISTKESFQEYLENSYDFIASSNGKDPSASLAKHIDKFWEQVIKPSFSVYSDMDIILTNAEVGFIELNNAQIVDAQNVFSKVNSGGTQLNAAELLSAKPYWNKPAVPSIEQQKKIDCLYSKLKTGDGNEETKQYCRWDIVATLLPSIDSRHLFFSSQNDDMAISSVNVLEIAMGFKLISSCFAVPRGMSKLSLDNLETKDSKLDWNDNLTSYIVSIKKMIDVIHDKTNLTILPDWGNSIYDMLGAAATMELIAGAWIIWHEDGVCNKSFSSVEFDKFIKGFKNHFDRAIMDKVLGGYKGSGDSKMAMNLKDISKRTCTISPEENDKWNLMIEEAINGTLNGKPFKHESMKPLLLYEKVIHSCSGLPGESFDIDHIYPQAMFEAGNGILESLEQNSLANLALLPSVINKQKQNKKLNHTNFDNNVRNSISKFEMIDTNEFEKYSQPENFKSLKSFRGDFLQKTFDEDRQRYLNS